MARSRKDAARAVIIRFRKNETLLAGSSAAGIELTALANADVLGAIANDAPFPEREIDLAECAAQGEGGRDVLFGEGAARVSFGGSANAFAGVGVYSRASSVQQEISQALALPDDADHRYLVLRWGYDVKGSARGSMALGGVAGAVKFGADAVSDGLFAVIHRFPRALGARSALERAVNCWRPIRSIGAAADLEPGTWAVAEVDGSVAVKLGATFGYDLNWVRELQAGGLSGDIGLRIQLGISAQVGFSSSGKYCVVVGRESLDPVSQVLRLRLYKRSHKGWNFALNAAATAAGDFGALPEKSDDFIRGIFGVHGAQVIKSLQALEEWTDPRKPLPSALQDLGAEYVQKLLTDLTGLDAATAFEAARTRLLSLFRAWDNLPQRAASVLWKLVEEKTDVAKLRRLLAKAEDESALRGLIEKQLSKVDFFRKPEGQLLEALALNGTFGALTNASEFKALQEGAAQVGALLQPDGAFLRVLTGLQAYVNQTLDLEKLRDIVTKSDFDSLDAMLRKKVSDFLGKKFEFSDVEAVRTAIHLLLGKREDFYQKTVQALKRKYEFEFAAAYSKSTSQTALLDVEFDFKAKGRDLAALWRSALDGDFTRILLDSRRGVKLNAAVLTHGVSRSTHVDISLPFYKGSIDHMNSALAKGTVVAEDGGRLIVYELTAEDSEHSTSVLPWKRTERDSRLTVGAYLPMDTASGKLRVHSTDSLTYTYSFDQARSRMKRAELQYQVKPLVENYLADCFAPGADPFDTWISDLDRTIDAIEDNGSDNFGNTLLSLDVTLPGQVPAAWLRAPAAKNDPAYLAMSRNIQAALKRLIPSYYFQDPGRYAAAQPPACALLVYAAMPPITDKGPHWDYLDQKKRRGAIGAKQTSNALAVALKDVSDLLKGLGKTGDAAFYTQAELGKILKSASAGMGEQLLIGLLRMEAEIIRAACQAGRRMGEFRAASDKDPRKAVDALEEFGATLTKAFHAKVGSVYGGGALRTLGAMVFVEAARAFDPEIGAIQPKAMLQLTVVKKDLAFPPPGFPDEVALHEQDIVIEQRLVSV